MSRASPRDRARPQPAWQLRRPARRLVPAALQRCGARRGSCRGWSATPSARCSASRSSRCCPRRCRSAPDAGLRHAARRHSRVFRPREAGPAAALPHGRLPGARRRRRRSSSSATRFTTSSTAPLICTATLTSVPLGINTAIAVAAHEIPQEVGDVAILLAAGYSRAGALMLNVVSGASGIAGALLAFRRRRSRARHPAVRARVLVGQPALHRDVRSDSRSASRRGRRERDPSGAAHRRRHRDGRRIRTTVGLNDADQANLATVETMWRREVEAAHTYRLLADRETNPKRRDILLRLADQEDKHAARWSERIAGTTGQAPDPRADRARASRGFSASAIRTSSCIVSSRKRTRPKPTTTCCWRG